MNLNNDDNHKVSYEEFKKTLQCINHNVDQKHGTLSIINNIHPLRKEFVENAAGIIIIFIIYHHYHQYHYHHYHYYHHHHNYYHYYHYYQHSVS